MVSTAALLTGASGYIGGRLLHRLEADARRRLRCLTRHPAALAGRAAAGTEVVVGDVLEPRSLASAMRGVATAYYLVHSMGASADFERLAGAAHIKSAITDGGHFGEDAVLLSPIHEICGGNDVPQPAACRELFEKLAGG